MRDNSLINEAEMFVTDLEFRSDEQGNVQDFIGDLTKKQDDVIRNIQACLEAMIKYFRGELKKIQNEDPTLDTDDKKMKRMRSLALCVYFATYFRLDHNRDSSDLF